jgi:hypothetical protein
MGLSLSTIRQRLKEMENRKTSTSSQDNQIFPHWNIPENTTATLRFLPDANESNEFFWVERQQIKLPFSGIEGNPDSHKVIVNVPCIEMYGETCPVHAELREWYKDESLKQLANSYWKKRSYLFQGFVRSSQLQEQNIPENPIRRFLISPQLLPIIKEGIKDPEVLEIPTHYQRGLDFIIKKSKKGEYADYSTSNWSRRESALSELELEAIEKHGLFDLASFLPKKPTPEEVEVIYAMFSASVEGQQYSHEKWGKYFKPANSESNTVSGDDSDKNVRRVVTPPSLPLESTVRGNDSELETVSEPVVVPTVTKQATSASSMATDILAQLKARKK